RPPCSYASLIAQAILSSEPQRLTLQEIYNWLSHQYPNLTQGSDAGWKNTVRHNLSLNGFFCRTAR
ncbi:winged helix DNA-binding domain-containing protein, partial [Ramicandelaber brevisporus]